MTSHTNVFAGPLVRPLAASTMGLDRIMVGVFTVTLFLSSGLIFIVEPMFAKMVLPQLGGSPEVWNTCVVFFQIMMLAAYGYAHLTTSRLRLTRQIALHVVLLAAAAYALPVAIPAGWAPPVDR